MERRDIAGAFVKSKRASDETVFPRSRNNHETVLKRATFIKGADPALERPGRTSSMVELVALLIALFSAGIFLAHAIEAYRAYLRARA